MLTYDTVTGMDYNKFNFVLPNSEGVLELQMVSQANQGIRAK